MSNVSRGHILREKYLVFCRMRLCDTFNYVKFLIP